MKRYLVVKGFHFGEICQDIHVGGEIFFDENTGNLQIGDFKHKVRISPIVGVIKNGWLRLADEEQTEEESSQKFEGDDEARLLDGSVEKKETKKKKSYENIEYAQDEIPVDPTKTPEEPKKGKIKIGRENREETDAITFNDLKGLTEEDDSEITKAWDMQAHWQKKRKKLEQITNINTLMKLASLDEKMRPRIEKRIKEIANLGEEVDHKLSSLNDPEESKKPVKEKKPKKAKKAPKKATKKTKSNGKGKNPKKVPLGRDFNDYLKEQVQSNEIQTK